MATLDSLTDCYGTRLVCLLFCQECTVDFTAIVSCRVRIGIVVNWVGENQPMGLESVPVLGPPLQRSQLARNKHAGMLPSQAVEEFFCR